MLPELISNDGIMNELTENGERSLTRQFLGLGNGIANAKTETEMQQIVNKAQEFYNLNDIEINPKKSELVIINKNKNREARGISLGRTKERVVEKKQKDLSRF